MRIALVGPTHPSKGGVAQHTAVLAQNLAAAGHEVEVVSWERQYPGWLYPGVQEVHDPDAATFPDTRRTLRWDRPATWLREARSLRAAELVIVAHVTPVQVPPYLTMARSLRRAGTPVVVLCHNVLPHEGRVVDRRLVRALLGVASRVVVHTESEAEVARALTSSSVSVARLAPHLPSRTAARPAPGVHRRLLFFGLVRPYKGLDLALRALAAGPEDVRMRVAGEFWGGVEATRLLCDELAVTDRVELRPGYVATDDIPALFADVDALVLPYRSATGSQAVWQGFQMGVPVIVTSAGHLADDVRPGVDGLVARPDDVASLTAAFHAFYAPGEPERLRSGVRPAAAEPYWRVYLDTLLDRPSAEG